MKNINVIAAQENKVLRDGLALILATKNSISLVGREGVDVLSEATRLQPDLVVIELSAASDAEYELVKQIYYQCRWTRVFIFTLSPLVLEDIRRFLPVSHYYVQGPILPGHLLELVELACFSNRFFVIAPNGENYELSDEPASPDVSLNETGIN